MLVQLGLCQTWSETTLFVFLRGGSKFCIVTEMALMLLRNVHGYGGSSLTNEKDHHYFLNRFVCVGEFFDG